MYIDFHSHLDFYKQVEQDDVLLELEKYNIYTLSCGMDEDSYVVNKELAARSKQVLPLFGIHPEKAYENLDNLDKLDRFIQETPMIGEIGLDFHWITNEKTYEAQREVFHYFLKRAKYHDKFINVHTKGAEEEILQWIKKYDLQNQTIIHWYSGRIDTLKQFVDAGCYFTASVDLGITKEANERMEYIPTAQLLAETDGPTALEWLTGEYGRPKEIIRVYEKICTLKKIDIDEYQHHCDNVLQKIMKR